MNEVNADIYSVKFLSLKQAIVYFLTIHTLSKACLILVNDAEDSRLNLLYRFTAQTYIDPPIGLSGRIFGRQKVGMRDSISLEVCVGLLYLLLELDSFEPLFAEATPLSQGIRADIEVENEVRLD